MKNDASTLLRQCLELYGMEVPEFSHQIEVPKSTVQGWLDGRSSAVAVALLKASLRNKMLEDRNAKVNAFLSLAHEMI